ncbi:hypothetical protein JHK87_052114 [Glycine soja]|nr:hypothetical protein JHK87_052114 [Glycine soja]
MNIPPARTHSLLSLQVRILLDWNPSRRQTSFECGQSLEACRMFSFGAELQREIDCKQNACCWLVMQHKKLAKGRTGFSLEQQHAISSSRLVVFPVRLAHKIDLSKCVVLLTHPSFEVDNDKRRRSNWRCGRGSEEWEVQEACRAVSSYLGELGVSLEDSVWMASKSPEYVKMLVEGVRDLEQWHEWDAGLSFRDKILHIAPQKGDKGKVAYLETLGFSLSSSMNIARYFSADTLTLPSLMHKVTRIKQLLFFSPSPDHHLLLIKNIPLMMRHLSISVDQDLQHTLSFFF